MFILKKFDLRQMLLSAIRFYRARLSQRGPLKQVCCTFGGIESCSAYAERVAQELPFHRALLMIFARLRRCRDYSVFRFEDYRLGWDRGFDRVLASHKHREQCAEMDRRLFAQRESDAARQSILLAADAMRCNQDAFHLRRQRCGLAIRDANAVTRHLHRRVLRLILQIVLSSVAAIYFTRSEMYVGLAVAACLMVLGFFAVTKASHRLTRLRRQRILAQLECDVLVPSMSYGRSKMNAT